jgi:hypothetical protein
VIVKEVPGIWDGDNKRRLAHAVILGAGAEAGPESVHVNLVESVRISEGHGAARNPWLMDLKHADRGRPMKSERVLLPNRVTVPLAGGSSR